MAKVWGLKAVKLGAPAADGGMGTTLTEVFGATVKGSASLTASEPTSEEVEIEETDSLYDEITTKGAVWLLKISTYNISATTMAALFGGTVTGTAPASVWTPPVDGVTPSIYQSVNAESRTGIKFDFVKMKVVGVPNITFDKTKLGQLDITFKMVMPDKPATAPMKVTFA